MLLDEAEEDLLVGVLALPAVAGCDARRFAVTGPLGKQVAGQAEQFHHGGGRSKMKVIVHTLQMGQDVRRRQVVEDEAAWQPVLDGQLDLLVVRLAALVLRRILKGTAKLMLPSGCGSKGSRQYDASDGCI